MRSCDPVPEIRFVHVPRTGGSSIREGWDLGEPECQGHAPPAAAGFIYGAVRNPWDRVVSLYHYLELERRGYSFRGWVLAGLDPSFATGSSFEITRPCAWWLRPLDAGPWVDRPDVVYERGLRNADFVVRFENREDDLRRLAEFLDRPYPEGHVGATERGPYREYYDAETRDVVGRLFEEDVRLFGYEF